MDWRSLATFSSPSASGAHFTAPNWICNCDGAASRPSFWEASQRTWASSRRHDRHGNTAMPSFLPKMPRAPCPRKCTTLLSATSFQGSAGSSKVLISRFLMADSVPSMSLATFPVFARWGVLIALSVLFAALLTWARLPAALLLGSMLAGILVENGGAGILVPQLPFGLAQAVVGCMIARVLTSTILHSFLHQWPALLGISFSVIAASCLLGWIISKFRILPETTAIWGLLPGAAPAMMVMADAYGADARLVAFMQYVRVVMVAIVASIIARLWVHAPAVASAAPADWFAPIHALPFFETLVLVLAAVILGPISRIPAGMFLIPMFVGAVLQINGLVEIELPSWLLAVSYLVLGWTISLRFTREILVYAIRALPKMIVSILMLIAFCGALAWALVEVFDIDPLTAYLATSPGGADRSPLLRHPPMSMSGLLWRSRSLVLCSSLSLVRLCPDLSRIKIARDCSKYFRQNSHLRGLVAEDLIWIIPIRDACFAYARPMCGLSLRADIDGRDSLDGYRNRTDIIR